jgi:hypothetical protein
MESYHSVNVLSDEGLEHSPLASDSQNLAVALMLRNHGFLSESRHG